MIPEYCLCQLEKKFKNELLQRAHTIVMAEEGCKLFVYGIDQNMANGDIQSEFEKYGAVTDVYNTGKG